MDLTSIACGICAIACSIVGLAEGFAGSKAMEAAGRNPEATGKLRSLLIVAVALIETSAIYSLVIAILLIFVG